MTSISTSKTDRQPAEGAAYRHLDDGDLVRTARSDGRAFGELYRRHFNKVYGYHLLRTGNVDDAQDLTSQTFMAAMEGLGKYDGRGSFAAWLMSIAHNKMAMHFRGKRPEADLDAAEKLTHPALPPEDQALRRGLLRQVGSALRSLTPERAEAFVLRTFGGLSASEAAQVLGKSEPAVKMLVYRALQDIRQKLEPERSLEAK